MSEIKSIQQVVDATQAALSAQGAELVAKVKGVVAYDLGKESFTVDLKNGSGSVKKGEAFWQTPAAVHMRMYTTKIAAHRGDSWC